jgi:hypothetical protein
MSGSHATLRIVSGRPVSFTVDDDLLDDEAARLEDDALSWRKGNYDTIRPYFVNIVEEKATRRRGADQVPYPEYLARVFWTGCGIFILGVILLIVCSFTHHDRIKVIAWLVMAIGAATAALSLLRAQDLDPRLK